MASLALSLDELKRNLAMVLAIDRDPGEWSQIEINDVDRIIREGRRKFFAAYTWSFLERDVSIPVEAPFSDGTCTVVDGVVTLTDPWPGDPTAYKFVPDEVDGDKGPVFEILSATPDGGGNWTDATLADTTVDVDAGTTFTLYRTKYELPADFGGFLSPVYLENNDEAFLTEVAYQVLPDHVVRGAGNINRVITGVPTMFSVFQDTDPETGVPTWRMDIYPLPRGHIIAKAKMRVYPGDALTEDSDICPPHFSSLMQEAILSVAEQLYNDVAGVHTQMYLQQLPNFINVDRKMRGVRAIPRRGFRPAFNPLAHANITVPGINA